MPEKNITIEDIAKALNVSKTTVSRAISGKGRISIETKERVQKYIEKHNYRPNQIARSLAESKSYNIGFVMPNDYAITDLTFYQKCLWGISNSAAAFDYDVMVAMVSPDDLNQLDRMVVNGKVDGMIIGRTSSVNTIERYLKSKNFPFVTVGTSVDSTVFQVDNDHEGACQELTAKLIKRGIRKLGLIGGDTKYIVNRNRYHGYIKAFENADMKIYEERIFLSCDTDKKIVDAVDKCIEEDVECILCMDDDICIKVLNKLNTDGRNIPEDIKIASFYDSSIMHANPISITAISFDEAKLGEVATKSLIEQINKDEPIKKVLLGYEIQMRESTEKR